MCGIVGIVGAGNRSNIESLTDSVLHRGPDGRGVWSSDDGRLSLGHRRLSVIDPRVISGQPMWSQDGRHVIVFNGEIYNFREIRSTLSGISWRTTSDTEVLVELIAQVGIEGALRRLNGMFALAVYDTHKRELHLARDRLGEKPLYYGTVEKDFVFASELKAFVAHKGFQRQIDRDSLALYLRYSYVPAPRTIYDGVRKLEPAQFMTMSVSESGVTTPIIKPYWEFRTIAEAGAAKSEIGDSVALDKLDEQLRKSVASRMVADVPLGAFLSGGYDSTLVVAMMSQSASEVKTFTIGMQEEGFNEADHAREVARHLGTSHTELIVTADDALALIPQMPRTYCEPFGDASQIPTCLVASLARKHVTVALSGDGGDELFGGYNRHFWASPIWGKLERLPAWLRSALGRLLKSATVKQLDFAYSILRGILGRAQRTSRPGEKLHKLASVMHAKSPVEFYQLLTSAIQQPNKLLVSGSEPLDKITDSAKHASVANFADLMMYLDTITYLPDDILTKVDRATMAVSLEARVPLLDHELVEHAWRMPQHMKIRNGEGKWALKQIVHRYVPEKLMKRPKMGFSIPIDHWFRGKLKSYTESILLSPQMEKRGYFNSAVVRQMLTEHQALQKDHSLRLWSLLMLELWHRAYIDREPS